MSERARTTGGTARGVTFEPARALAADLRDLGVDLEAGSYTSTTLAMFRRDLRRAVPSALGATISFVPLHTDGCPLEIHLVDRTVEPDEIGAGLLLSLSRLRDGLTGSVLFYAELPSAFEGLVRDLRAVIDARSQEIDERPSLPRAPISPSVAGLEDFSLVNRALGVLLSRGCTLSEARSELAARAEREDTDLSRAARSLLSSYR